MCIPVQGARPRQHLMIEKRIEVEVQEAFVHTKGIITKPLKRMNQARNLTQYINFLPLYRCLIILKLQQMAYDMSFYGQVIFYST